MRNVIFIAALAALLISERLVNAAEPPVCGDVNGSGRLTSSDALAVLKAAVGQPTDLQCPPPSLPQTTGQEVCFTANGLPISCQSTGQDGDLRMGLARSYTDNGDGTITDNNTGLMWEKLDNSRKAGLAGIHTATRLYVWSDALGKVAALNFAGFAGYNDWRLPNISELMSLIDISHEKPAIDSVFNTNCVADCTIATCSCTGSEYTWSSTTSQFTPANAWIVDFTAGGVSVDFKTTPDLVRAVRGGL